MSMEPAVIGARGHGKLAEFCVWKHLEVTHLESGYRTYIITAKRMISGDVLKYRKGLLIRECHETAIFGSSEFLLKLPLRVLLARKFNGRAFL